MSQEASDPDFESLLDAALGLETDADSKQPRQEPAAPHSSPPGSPCISCDSSINWVVPEQFPAAGSYSPVREDPVDGPQQQQLVGCDSSAATHSSVCFTSLPREVLMRVLCLLSADALTILAQTCQQLRHLSGEPVLWRRLYCFRWGKQGRQQNQQQSWKARYMERDLTELRAAGGSAVAFHHQQAEAMQEMFVQAHLAKRQQVLPRAAVDDVMLVEDDELAARVLAWRKSRGFASGQAHQGPPGSWQHIQRPADLGQHMAAAAAAAAAAGLSGHSRAGGAAGHSRGWGSSGSGGGGSIRGGRRAAEVVVRRPAAVMAAAAALSPPPAAAAAAAAAVPAGGCGHQVASSSAGPSAAAAQGASSTAAGTAAPTPAAAAAAAGRRVRQRRRWTQIGNVFCDEMTGWVHVCDECCSEQIVEPGSGLLVCPISGQVTDRMMSCAEEAAEEGQHGCGDEEGRGQGDEDYGGERGRLARAFAAGYYCSNERELMRECGVRLSR